MKMEEILLNQERNVTLTAYLQAASAACKNSSQRPGILILPGGGYQFCSEMEADPVAMPYLKAGYQVFILRYSVGKHAIWPKPLNDYEQAITYIRNHATVWNLNPDSIAVIGFSAGGHLAAAAATIAVHRPNAVILGYAVTGEDVHGCNPTAPDTICSIDDQTPPCFLFATRTDEIVPVINTVKFMEGLIEKNISFESHIYSHGRHGFSTCDPNLEAPASPNCSRISHWVEDSLSWLGDVLGTYGGRKPVIKAQINGDRAPYLSIDCTIGCIMQSPKGKKIFEEYFRTLPEITEEKKEANPPTDLLLILQHIPLVDFLTTHKVSSLNQEHLNTALSSIPNPFYS